MISATPRSEIRKKFGIFLKEARENAGFTQKEIVKELGFKSCQSLSNIERGLCPAPTRVGKYLIMRYKISNENFIEYLAELYALNLKIKFGLVKDIEKVKFPEFKKKS